MLPNPIIGCSRTTMPWSSEIAMIDAEGIGSGASAAGGEDGRVDGGIQPSADRARPWTAWRAGRGPVSPPRRLGSRRSPVPWPGAKPVGVRSGPSWSSRGPEVVVVLGDGKLQSAFPAMIEDGRPEEPPSCRARRTGRGCSRDSRRVGYGGCGAQEPPALSQPWISTNVGRPFAGARYQAVSKSPLASSITHEAWLCLFSAVKIASLRQYGSAAPPRVVARQTRVAVIQKRMLVTTLAAESRGPMSRCEFTGARQRPQGVRDGAFSGSEPLRKRRTRLVCDRAGGSRAVAGETDRVFQTGPKASRSATTGPSGQSFSRSDRERGRRRRLSCNRRCSPGRPRPCAL